MHDNARAALKENKIPWECYNRIALFLLKDWKISRKLLITFKRLEHFKEIAYFLLKCKAFQGKLNFFHRKVGAIQENNDY